MNLTPFSKSTLTPLILIDAGNTRIKWGLHDGETYVARGAIETARAGELGAQWPGGVKATRAVASNVAGAAVEALIRKACEGRGAALTVIRSQAEELGVSSGYRDPGQLGSDRWAALIA